VLEAAWDLIARKGRADVAMTEIAEKAGVSRQTIFYAFGSRSELLVAMVRHRDTRSDHVARIRACLETADPDHETILHLARIWIEYLPVIYPVGILLDAAALTDPDAEKAWNDRMTDGLRSGFRQLAAAVHRRAPFDRRPDRVADAVWAQVHPSMWRRLVVECGWSKTEFQRSQLALVATIIGSVGQTR